MPRYSDSTLLQQAIEPAINDRLGFADCYPKGAPEATEARALIEKIRALRDRAFNDLSEAEREIARLTFLFAQQWEEGYADSKPGRQYEQKALAAARRYREVRLRLFGRTVLEVVLASAKPVAFDEIKNPGQRIAKK